MTHVFIGALWVLAPALLVLHTVGIERLAGWGVFAACAAIALTERQRRKEAGDLERVAVKLLRRNGVRR